MTIKVIAKDEIPPTRHGKTSYAREALEEFYNSGADAAEITDWSEHYVNVYSLVSCVNGIIMRNPDKYEDTYATMRNGRVYIIRGYVRRCGDETDDK